MYNKSGKWNYSERIIGNKVVGRLRDRRTEKESDTTGFTIHYPKKGTSILPRWVNENEKTI